MKKYLSVISLVLNFSGAILITYSTGIYTEFGSALIMGKHVILSLHPVWLKIGVALLIFGFGLQLALEIIKLFRQEKTVREMGSNLEQ